MLTWLEQTAFASWVIGSNSIWIYPTILTLHTFGMMVLVGAALVLNLRLLGFARGVPLHSLQPLFRVMWIGFAINAATGSILFISAATARGTELLFWVKLALVGLGVVTALALRRSFDVTTENRIISNSTKRMSLLSLLTWSAAITAGRLLAYVR